MAEQCQGVYGTVQSLYHTMVSAPASWTAADEATLNSVCSNEGYAGTVDGPCLNELIGIAGAYTNGLPYNGLPPGATSQCSSSLGPNFHPLLQLVQGFTCMRQTPVPPGAPVPQVPAMCAPQIASAVKRLGLMDVRSPPPFPPCLPLVSPPPLLRA